VAISGAGLVVFIALFFAAIGATLYVVAVRHGSGDRRGGPDEP